MRGGASGGRWWGLGEDAGEQQIPFGNDNKKGKGKNKSYSRFPAGMTTRKAKTKATTKAAAWLTADD